VLIVVVGPYSEIPSLGVSLSVLSLPGTGFGEVMLFCRQPDIRRRIVEVVFVRDGCFADAESITVHDGGGLRVFFVAGTELIPWTGVHWLSKLNQLK